MTKTGGNPACTIILARWTALLGASLAGCGGSGDPRADAGYAGTDVAPPDPGLVQAAADWDQFCVRLGTLWASRVSQCTLGNPTSSALRREICDSVAASVLVGRIAFIEAQAQPCLDQIAAMPCSELVAQAAADIDLPAACSQVLQGSVGQSGVCTQSLDCVDPVTMACHLTGNCIGTCQGRPRLGETCHAGECTNGLTCESASGRCVPIAGPGEPCGRGVGTCSGLLVCDLSGTCVLPYVGYACAKEGWESFFSCGPFLHCEAADVGSGDVCASFKRPGEPCTPGAFECVSNVYCALADGGGICTVESQLGEACGPVLQGAVILETNACLEGYCDRPLGALSGTCQPFQQLGQSCSSDMECDSAARRSCKAGTCKSGACLN